jgi:hypothetical protein
MASVGSQPTGKRTAQAKTRSMTSLRLGPASANKANELAFLP